MTVRPERAADYLQHILDAIDRATAHAAHVTTLDAFKGNVLVQDGIVRNIEVIGEAAVKIQQMAPDLIASRPEIPWKDMRTMRNKIIHDYFDVDLDIVWNTVQRDLPRLAEQITDVLKFLRAGDQPPASPIVPP